ncbi:hypothetical protein AUJ68_03525 [Candidatus Woesearchaeota archaeon CG1_02_57_44]|nr:MAG: hypothetical protein AUJ68_03525 [Candidatus Woesearchaeota archaeon CG1_02_57_44]
MRIDETLAELVAFDTSSDNPTLPLATHIAMWAADLGFDVQRYGDCFEALIIRTQPALKAKRYIGLCGHLDTVPATDGWDTDPLMLTEAMVDGETRYYGLGAQDMKGPVACMMHALEKNQTVPAALALTYNEETDFGGARLLAANAMDILAPMTLIIGEPTQGRIGYAHASYTEWQLTITGKGGHSSDPSNSCNAMYGMACVLQQVKALSERLMQTPYDGFPGAGSMNPGVVRGGDANNRICQSVTMTGDLRLAPGYEPDDTLEELQTGAQRTLQEAGSACSIEVSTVCSYPSFFTSPSHPLIAYLSTITGKEATTLPFSTDAAIFNGEADLPALVCGPGSLDVCHQSNEYITKAGLQRGTAWYTSLLASGVGCMDTSGRL